MPDHVDPDDLILSRLAAQDDRAITMLFDRYYELLYATIIHYLPGPDDAHDILQELFLNIYLKRETLSFTKPLSRYLQKAALNRTRNFWRDRTRSRQLVLEATALERLNNIRSDTTTDSALSVEDINRLVSVASRRMSARVRYTFTLSRKQLLCNADIAVMMGISVKAVENNMTTAFRILREVLGPYLKIILVIPWLVDS